MMKAIGLRATGGVELFEEVEIPVPVPTGRQLLVKVAAVSMNPVDTKVRGSNPGPVEGPPKVLGYDASGVVTAVGPDASLFAVGDAVYYAGDISKQGTNAGFHVVDERIVGRKPKTLSDAEAAALPLTALTAYEALFEGANVPLKSTPRDLPHLETYTPVVLVVAGAGGVGSIAIQLLAQLSDATIIATASRPDTVEWCKSLGAHHTINHQETYKDQLDALGVTGVDTVLCGVDLDLAYDQILTVLNPMGTIVGITYGDKTKIDVTKLFSSRGRLLWELMFSRPRVERNMERQHAVLNQVADLVDAGSVRTTMTSSMPFTLDNLRKAHTDQASGKTIGKIVLTM